MAVPQKPRAARGAAKETSAPQAETTATSAPQASAFEQMGAAFRLPGVDFEALKAQWQAQLSQLPGFSPDLFQSWLQQSPVAGLNVPGLKPVQQAVDHSLLIALQGTEHGRQGVFAGIEGIQQLDQAVGGLARGGDDDQLVAAPLLLDEAGHPAITARIGQTTATKFMNLTTAQLLSTL